MNLDSVGMWGRYLGGKMAAGNSELLGLIASIDPNGISEAAIAGEINKLKRVGADIEERRRLWQEAHQAFTVADKLNSQQIASVEVLQRKLEDASTPEDKKPGLQRSIDIQMKAIEAAQPNLDHLHTIDDNKHATFEALNSAYDAKLQQLVHRKEQFEIQATEQARVKTEVESARERNEASLAAANLKSSATSSVSDAALKAMEQRTNRLKDEAASLNRMSEGLAQAKPEAHDDNIAEAMREVAGEKPATAQSLTERLAAIKAKQGERVAA